MIVIGNARQIPLPDGCVQCVVTSPPYWGLRDYGTATWEGGDPSCQHTARRAHADGDKQATNAKGEGSRDSFAGSLSCRRCGATRIDAQIGLEPTPDLYVQSLVEVFAEVGRVLRDDGTLWLNLGDSYASHDPGGWREGEFLNPGGAVPLKGQARNRAGNYRPGGLKPKDLIGIPWRVAFALQAVGWYLRSDIIWAKPNPMPESVRDRPTKSHEYVFLLTKAARYVYDADAIAESAISPLREKEALDGEDAVARKMRGFGSHLGTYETRNVRSVWTITTEPYPDAHFATMPTALVRRCLLAGSRPGDLVLDPFGGSGTVAEVADALGCRVLSMDLAPHYAPLAVARTRQAALPYAAEATL